MRNSIESKIRSRVVILYVLVAIICGIMVYFLNRARTNIKFQRAQIEEYRNGFEAVNEIITGVNNIQGYANIYVIKRDKDDLRLFNENLTYLDKLIDSVVREGYISDMVSLNELGGLFRQKGEIISSMSVQFAITNPFDTISNRIVEYESAQPLDSVRITTTVVDTIINMNSGRNFWDRLAAVFVPGRARDTIVARSLYMTDTVVSPFAESREVISQVGEVTRQAQRDYYCRISAVEKEMQRLLTTDLEISSRISVLAGDIYRRALESNLYHISRGEQRIKTNYTYSIAGTVFSLVAVLVIIFMIITDVNRGYRARLELEEANERIRNITESRHRLLLSISHDIKSPLNSILGYVELWKEAGSEIPSSELGAVKRSSMYILALINNLMDFSRIEKGILTVDNSLFDPARTERELLEMFEPMAKLKKIEFISDYRIGKEVKLVGDEMKIKQVAMNVLSNAFKYTREGSVAMRTEYSGGNYIITVRDTGVGIPSDKINTVFEPFTRIDANNNIAEGSGFGMYVVKALTEEMGGEITIRSRSAAGTTVIITIPAEESDPSVGSRKLKILVVDDDAVLLEVMGMQLSKMGHTVYTEQNPENIVLPASDLDLIITDMEMDKATGKDILAKVRECAPGCAVWLMSGKSDLDSARAGEMGFDGFLAKPVSAGTLASKIGFADSFSYSLEGLLAVDDREVREIISIFLEQTDINISKLSKEEAKNNFRECRFICHKMLPMFMQLDIGSIIVLLKKIDESGDSGYTGWQKDIEKICIEVESVCGKMKEDMAGL